MDVYFTQRLLVYQEMPMRYTIIIFFFFIFMLMLLIIIILFIPPVSLSTVHTINVLGFEVEGFFTFGSIKYQTFPKLIRTNNHGVKLFIYPGGGLLRTVEDPHITRGPSPYYPPPLC